MKSLFFFWFFLFRFAAGLHHGLYQFNPCFIYFLIIVMFFPMVFVLEAHLSVLCFDLFGLALFLYCILLLALEAFLISYCFIENEIEIRF